MKHLKAYEAINKPVQNLTELFNSGCLHLPKIPEIGDYVYLDVQNKIGQIKNIKIETTSQHTYEIFHVLVDNSKLTEDGKQYPLIPCFIKEFKYISNNLEDLKLKIETDKYNL